MSGNPLPKGFVGSNPTPRIYNLEDGGVLHRSLGCGRVSYAGVDTHVHRVIMEA